MVGKSEEESSGRTSSLRVSRHPLRLGSVFRFSLDSARCPHGPGSRSTARILTLTTSAHSFVTVVSMSARSVGGEEIQVFSPVGVARAAAIPVGVLEAGDLLGETPRGKKAKHAEPAEQTPDQKAEEIVRKTLGRIWRRRCLRT